MSVIIYQFNRNFSVFWNIFWKVSYIHEPSILYSISQQICQISKHQSYIFIFLLFHIHSRVSYLFPNWLIKMKLQPFIMISGSVFLIILTAAATSKSSFVNLVDHNSDKFNFNKHFLKIYIYISPNRSANRTPVQQ